MIATKTTSPDGLRARHAAEFARRAHMHAFVGLSALLLTACLDSPYGRPATMVDGTNFPPGVRGLIAPTAGYVDGEPMNHYLFDSIRQPRINTAIVFVDDSGTSLPACETGERDPDGVQIDTDLQACQAPVFPHLPTDGRYSPFLRITEVRVDRDYALNAVRSEDELSAAGLPTTDTQRVVDMALIDPSASVIDPANSVPRRLGWFDALQVVYLQLDDDMPNDNGQPTSMDLFVPEWEEPIEGAIEGAIAQARAGDTDYSPLCRVVYFSAPFDYEPGDYRDIDDIPVEDIIVPDPPEFFHCAVP